MLSGKAVLWGTKGRGAPSVRRFAGPTLGPHPLAAAGGTALGGEDPGGRPMLASLSDLGGTAVIGAGAERELAEVHDVVPFAGAARNAVGSARRPGDLGAPLVEEADPPLEAGSLRGYSRGVHWGVSLWAVVPGSFHLPRGRFAYTPILAVDW